MLLTFWNLIQGGKKRNPGQPHNAFGLLLMSTADTNGEWRAGEGINLPLPGMPAPHGQRIRGGGLLRPGKGGSFRNLEQLHKNWRQREIDRVQFLSRLRVYGLLDAGVP